MVPFATPQTEKAKIEQIVAEYYAKALHIILEARIPHVLGGQGVGGYGGSEHDSMLGGSGKGATNKWFNLELESSGHVGESVESWRRGACQEPMVVEIVLYQPNGAMEGGVAGRLERQRSSGNKWGLSPQRVADLKGESWEEGESFAPGGVSRTLLERWVVHYEQMKEGSWLGFGPVLAKQSVASGEGAGAGGASLEENSAGLELKGPASSSGLPANHALERPVVYKRTVIMLRSLYCLVRTLPAFRLFKLANSSSHSRSFSLSYTVSSASLAVSEQDEGAMIKCNLTPIETQWGRLCISSMYRNATAVTALEVTPRILSRIIADYVGSPTTDPLRRFTSVGSLPSGGLSGRHGVHVVSLPGDRKTLKLLILGCKLGRRVFAINFSSAIRGLVGFHNCA
jgi:autophagy-related protein 13